jgi:hypothetical protein
LRTLRFPLPSPMHVAMRAKGDSSPSCGGTPKAAAGAVTETIVCQYPAFPGVTASARKAQAVLQAIAAKAGRHGVQPVPDGVHLHGGWGIGLAAYIVAVALAAAAPSSRSREWW